MPRIFDLRSFWILAAATFLLALAAACGGDDTKPGDGASLPESPTADAGSAGSETRAPAPTVTPVILDTSTPEPAATPTRPAAVTPTVPRTARPTPSAEPTPIAPADLEGHWNGFYGLGGQEVQVSFKFFDGALTGTMDLPAHNRHSLDISVISLVSERLRMEVETPLGLAVWEGEVSNGVIEGQFRQAGLEYNFRLRRVDDSVDSLEADEKDSTAYRRDEVSFSNGSVSLAGDLTIPVGEGPFPVAVLIGKFGLDRDAYHYGFRMSRVLTDHIVGQGIAVLRFDDRGTGGSSGQWLHATLQDGAADVLAAVEMLQDRDDVDPEHIILIGHSDGGLAALIAANELEGIASLVLLATPAVPGDELIRAQVRAVLEVRRADDSKVEFALALQELVFKAVDSGNGWDELEQLGRTLVKEDVEASSKDWKNTVKDIEAHADAMTAQWFELYRSPFFKSFVEYEPGPDILSLEVPVLVLYGILDTLVPADQNSTAMSEALNESDIQHYHLESIWPANHVFQEAETGGVHEYNWLEPEFSPVFLEVLLQWLAEETESP